MATRTHQGVTSGSYGVLPAYLLVAKCRIFKIQAIWGELGLVPGSIQTVCASDFRNSKPQKSNGKYQHPDDKHGDRDYYHKVEADQQASNPSKHCRHLYPRDVPTTTGRGRTQDRSMFSQHMLKDGLVLRGKPPVPPISTPSNPARGRLR